MDLLQKLIDFIVDALLAEFIVVVAGVLFAQFIQSRWEKWRFGGWKVIIRRDGAELLKRDISPGKAQQILGEPADLAVFLKGVVSPYGWFNCDPLIEGKKNGMLTEDNVKRLYIIDLDKNPTPAKANLHPPGSS